MLETEAWEAAPQVCLHNYIEIVLFAFSKGKHFSGSEGFLMMLPDVLILDAAQLLQCTLLLQTCNLPLRLKSAPYPGGEETSMV